MDAEGTMNLRCQDDEGCGFYVNNHSNELIFKAEDNIGSHVGFFGSGAAQQTVTGLSALDRS